MASKTRQPVATLVIAQPSRTAPGTPAAPRPAVHPLPQQSEPACPALTGCLSLGARGGTTLL